MRRRQSSDYLSPLAIHSGERKLSHSSSGGATPLRERFGGMMRKRDGTGAHLFFFDLPWRYVNVSTLDQPAQTMPRKLSLSSSQGPLGSPRDSGLPSPRTRGPLAPGFAERTEDGDKIQTDRGVSDQRHLPGHDHKPASGLHQQIRIVRFRQEPPGRIDPPTRHEKANRRKD